MPTRVASPHCPPSPLAAVPLHAHREGSDSRVSEAGQQALARGSPNQSFPEGCLQRRRTSIDSAQEATTRKAAQAATKRLAPQDQDPIQALLRSGMAHLSGIETKQVRRLNAYMLNANIHLLAEELKKAAQIYATIQSICFALGINQADRLCLKTIKEYSDRKAQGKDLNLWEIFKHVHQQACQRTAQNNSQLLPLSLFTKCKGWILIHLFSQRINHTIDGLVDNFVQGLLGNFSKESEEQIKSLVRTSAKILNNFLQKWAFSMKEYPFSKACEGSEEEFLKKAMTSFKGTFQEQIIKTFSQSICDHFMGYAEFDTARKIRNFEPTTIIEKIFKGLGYVILTLFLSPAEKLYNFIFFNMMKYLIAPSVIEASIKTGVQQTKSGVLTHAITKAISDQLNDLINHIQNPTDSNFANTQENSSHSYIDQATLIDLHTATKSIIEIMRYGQYSTQETRAQAISLHQKGAPLPEEDLLLSIFNSTSPKQAALIQKIYEQALEIGLKEAADISVKYLYDRTVLLGFVRHILSIVNEFWARNPDEINGEFEKEKHYTQEVLKKQVKELLSFQVKQASQKLLVNFQTSTDTSGKPNQDVLQAREKNAQHIQSALVDYKQKARNLFPQESEDAHSYIHLKAAPSIQERLSLIQRFNKILLHFYTEYYTENSLFSTQQGNHFTKHVTNSLTALNQAAYSLRIMHTHLLYQNLWKKIQTQFQKIRETLEKSQEVLNGDHPEKICEALNSLGKSFQDLQKDYISEFPYTEADTERSHPTLQDILRPDSFLNVKIFEVERIAAQSLLPSQVQHLKSLQAFLSNSGPIGLFQQVLSNPHITPVAIQKEKLKIEAWINRNIFQKDAKEALKLILRNSDLSHEHPQVLCDALVREATQLARLVSEQFEQTKQDLSKTSKELTDSMATLETFYGSIDHEQKYQEHQAHLEQFAHEFRETCEQIDPSRASAEFQEHDSTYFDHYQRVIDRPLDSVATQTTALIEKGAERTGQGIGGFLGGSAAAASLYWGSAAFGGPIGLAAAGVLGGAVSVWGGSKAGSALAKQATKSLATQPQKAANYLKDRTSTVLQDKGLPIAVETIKQYADRKVESTLTTVISTLNKPSFYQGFLNIFMHGVSEHLENT